MIQSYRLREIYLSFYFSKYIVLKIWKSNEVLDFLGSILEHGVVERANPCSEACPPSSPPLALCPALGKTSHILQAPCPSSFYSPSERPPLSTPWVGHAASGGVVYLREAWLQEKSRHWAPGQLVREVYGPRYLGHGLGEEKAQVLSGHTPWALCTPHPVDGA